MQKINLRRAIKFRRVAIVAFFTFSAKNIKLMLDLCPGLSGPVPEPVIRPASTAAVDVVTHRHIVSIADV